MRHTNFIKKSSSFQVVNSSNVSFQIYKFSLLNGIEILPTPTITQVEDYYFTTIITENQDYFIFILWDSIIEIVRVGDPDILTIGYSGTAEQIQTYKQYSYTGNLLDEGIMTEIAFGFYYIQPIQLVKSFFDIDGSLISLVTPYKIINCSETSGDGYSGDELFLDTGFGTFGFIGEKHSYFDLILGQWISDINAIAKASDLAKAVAYKYGLEWEDRTSPTHIYNYIKYLRTYDENSGVFRLYAPAITPENNLANFNLITEDELGNTFIKGVSILTTTDLTTVPTGESGIIIPFK